MKSLNNKTNDEAMEFAYAMGLRREDEETEEAYDAMSFAYAMGLKRYVGGLGKLERHERSSRPVTEPKFA